MAVVDAERDFPRHRHLLGPSLVDRQLDLRFLPAVVRQGGRRDHRRARPAGGARQRAARLAAQLALVRLVGGRGVAPHAAEGQPAGGARRVARPRLARPRAGRARRVARLCGAFPAEGAPGPLLVQHGAGPRQRRRLRVRRPPRALRHRTVLPRAASRVHALNQHHHGQPVWRADVGARGDRYRHRHRWRRGAPRGEHAANAPAGVRVGAASRARARVQRAGRRRAPLPAAARR
mmetsp:Transcript_3101/g.7016  ORF Transcript_3101/g.7016 Transcript_3101/m.7016 type:complete len:234 (+) Transcript_3101:1960-2661(+)